MQIVRHRRNTIEELKETPNHLGIEVDIRSEGEKLIVIHDPFIGGIDFVEWIAAYRHGLLILNTKEEGLEQRLLQHMKERNIDNFFFLDQSFPFLIKTARTGEKRCAVRISEYESLQTALALKGLIEWVWVDYFTHFPLSAEEIGQLKAAGFKLCLVSPELQGYDETHIARLKREMGLILGADDAVCTKRPELWA
jgi:hypothetical protein